jgi:hypothetical protein
MCRQPITAIQYNFTADRNCDTHTFGPGGLNPLLLSGPFIPKDEELRPEMSAEERGRVLEMRRMRQIDDYISETFSLGTDRVWCIEGETCIFADRAIMLHIKQNTAPGTITQFGRIYKINTVEDFDPAENERNFGPQEPETVQRVREEVNRIVAGIAEFRGKWKELSIEGPDFFHVWDERGLTCLTNTVTRIERSQDRENVTLEKGRILKEVYDAVPPDLGEFDQENVKGIGRMEREEQVRLVREEVQGFLEKFRSIFPNWRGLERGCTGILEPIPEGRTRGCEYCGKGHRNGNCELSEIGMVGPE